MPMFFLIRCKNNKKNQEFKKKTIFFCCFLYFFDIKTPHPLSERVRRSYSLSVECSLLLYHLHRPFEECCERSPFEHAILQQSQVNQLVNNVISFCEFGNDLVLHIFLAADILLCGRPVPTKGQNNRDDQEKESVKILVPV